MRGLVDTDGSVCPHPNCHIFLDFTSKIPSLFKSSLKAFNDMGLVPTGSKTEIYLYGKSKVLNYFKIVGSSNIKHIIKLDEFIKTGKTPLSSAVEKIIKANLNKRFNLPYYLEGL